VCCLCTTCLIFAVALTLPPESYSLSLHDALPICARRGSRRSHGCRRRRRFRETAQLRPVRRRFVAAAQRRAAGRRQRLPRAPHRSEEHTSELQSRENLVCRLLLEKKKEILILSFK